GDLRQHRPVPIGKREARVSAQLANGALEVSEIAAMPDVEPPVAVGTIHEVDEGVSEPVPRIICRQLEHGFHAFGVAHQHLLPIRTRGAVTGVLRRRARGYKRQIGGQYGRTRGGQESTACEISIGHALPSGQVIKIPRYSAELFRNKYANAPLT